MGDTKTVRIRPVKKHLNDELPPAIGLEDSHLAVREVKAVTKVRIVKDDEQPAEAPKPIPPAIKPIEDMTPDEKQAKKRKFQDLELKLQDKARRTGFGINRDIEAMKKSIKLGDETAKALSIRARNLAREKCTTPVETAFMTHAASLLLNPMPGTKLDIRHVDYPKASDVIEIRNVDVATSDIDELLRDTELLLQALPNKVEYKVKALRSMCEVRIYPEKTVEQALNSCPRPEEASYMYGQGIKLLKPLPGKKVEVTVHEKSGTIKFENVEMDTRYLDAMQNEGKALVAKWGKGHSYLVKADFEKHTVTCVLPG